MNWQMDANGSVKIVTVGRFDASAAPGQELFIDEDVVIWNNGKKKVIISIYFHGTIE